MKARAELITEQNYARKIEIAARTCYKSCDKMTHDSAKRMLKYLQQEKHTSVFEHYRVVISTRQRVIALLHNKYVDVFNDGSHFHYSTNFRALLEIYEGALTQPDVMGVIYQRLMVQYPLVFFKEIDFPPMTKDPSLVIKQDPDYATFRITCDRTISHQIVRHRVMSFSQESQRYCNYGKKGLQTIDSGLTGWRKWLLNSSVKFSEVVYNCLLKAKVKPQQARLVLPNITKTEIVVTAKTKDWEWFLHLRNDPKHADPRIVEIAQQIKEALC